MLSGDFLGFGRLPGWRSRHLLAFPQDVRILHLTGAGTTGHPMGTTWFLPTCLPPHLQNPIDPTFCRRWVKWFLTLSRGPNFGVKFCKSSQMLPQWLSAVSSSWPAWKRSLKTHLSVDLALSCKRSSATEPHNGSFEVQHKCEFIVL